MYGYIFLWQGKLQQAFDIFEQSYDLCEKTNRKLGKAWNLYGFGLVYSDKGELTSALDSLEQGLAIATEVGYKPLIVMLIESIGNVYRQKGEKEKAILHYERSLSIYEGQSPTRDPGFVARTLLPLISVAIDTNSLDKAQQYLQRLQQLDQLLDSKLVNQRYRVAKALLLKSSTRVRHWGKAAEILEHVVTEEAVEHEVTIIALLNLCDLLLTELHISNDLEVLHEVQAHVTRLQEIAMQQHSYWLLAGTYVLQSKLSLVKLDVHEARQLLEQAQQLAEERGLRRLAIQISTEHDTLLNQLNQWEDLINRNVSLSERAELAYLSEFLVRMVNQRIEDIPEPLYEEPELLLIIGMESGLNVFSKTFQTDQPVEEHLIAGFLTAINALIQDAFATTGTIERIKHEEYTMILQPMGPFLVCYIFQGPSYGAIQKVSKFIETVQPSSAVWELLMDALQTRRLLTGKTQIETLVKEIFLPPIESH